MKKNINRNINLKYILILISILIIIVLLVVIFYKKRILINEHFNDNSITYILCSSVNFIVYEDYINSFIDKLSNHKIVVYNPNNLNEIPANNNIDKFIFLYYIPDEILSRFNENSNNIYLINTEQLSRPSEASKIMNYPKFVKMIDYSRGNLKYYTNFKPKLIEYQINNNEILNLPKTNNICIINGLSERRQQIINQLKEKNINVDIINGWKNERDSKLFTYKIILNIGYSDEYKIMESIRCNRCVYNKMIVISDIREDMDSYPLKNNVIFVEYDKLTDKVIEVLNNYENYYQKLGLDTLDLNKIPINTNIDLE